jgi:hypothetical protein
MMHVLTLMTSLRSSVNPTGVFKRLDANLPRKSGQSVQHRSEDICNASIWMRRRGLDPTWMDGEDILRKKTGLVPANLRSAEDRVKDMESVFELAPC